MLTSLWLAQPSFLMSSLDWNLPYCNRRFCITFVRTSDNGQRGFFSQTEYNRVIILWFLWLTVCHFQYSCPSPQDTELLCTLTWKQLHWAQIMCSLALFKRIFSPRYSWPLLFHHVAYVNVRSNHSHLESVFSVLCQSDVAKYCLLWWKCHGLLIPLHLSVI